MSAHSAMRRTLLFVFVLLVVGAGSAVASAVGSTKAHGKATTHARVATHKQSHASAAARRSHAHKAAKPTVHPAADVAPLKKTTTPAVSSGNASYAIGYRNGYDAGRAAALKELQAQNAHTKLRSETSNTDQARAESSTYPAAPTRTAGVQKQQAAIQKPAAAPQIDSSDEPSDADPSIDPATTAQPEQYKSEAQHKDRTSSTEADNARSVDIAALELPRAGTPISLRGSLASLQRQNSTLEAEGLERILDEDDLNSRITHGLLTPLPTSANLTVNPGLPENRRYCRPWTARFLKDLAKAHATAFRHPLQVNSAVRTVEYQKRLMRTNGNAAAAEGDIVSPHLTGATIDIGKQGMTHTELVWMRRHLFALQSAGKIDVEEEFEQACFHITVYKTYLAVPQVHKPASPALRDAAAPEKPATPSVRRRSSLPSSIAVGTFTAR